MRIQHEGLTYVVELLDIKCRLFFGLRISPGKFYSLDEGIFTFFVIKITERKEIGLRATGLLKKKLEFSLEVFFRGWSSYLSAGFDI